MPCISQLSGYSVVEAPVVVVSGEGSGEVGTSYSLACRVTLPLGVAEVSPNIQWKRPNMPYTPASTPDSTSSRQFHTTLELNTLQSTNAGEYICQASYSLGGYISPLVRDSLTLAVISKSYRLNCGLNHSHRHIYHHLDHQSQSHQWLVMLLAEPVAMDR